MSDRGTGWTKQYRNPDNAVFLPGNTAINHGTHWQGGPDFLSEILSKGDRALEKFEFYARIGTREVFIIDREPWQLELFQLTNGTLTSVGTSSLATPNVLTSLTLPVTFRLVSGTTRPQIEVADTNTGQVWLV